MKEFLNKPPPSEMMYSLGIYWLSSRDFIRNSFVFSYNNTIGLEGILGAPINY